MAASNPWDSASEPNAAGLLLSHFLASGMVTEVRGGDRSVIEGLPVVATKDGCEVVVPMRVMLGAREKQPSDRFAVGSTKAWSWVDGVWSRSPVFRVSADEFL